MTEIVQEQDLAVVTSKHRQKREIVQAVKINKHPFVLPCMRACCSFTNHSVSLASFLFTKVPLWFRTEKVGDFPGGPEVKTLCFHCRGYELGPRFGN